ncbi:MAG: hypothetical protein EOP83_03485 [Verrucomicrobiaceae bacterium]|nr:MAG: hypothetical protein EOP83_03485 [Verrucomicrobiaceae bacterium]
MSESRRVHLIVGPPLSEAARKRLKDIPRGTLRDYDTDELLISATVDYIKTAIADRGLTLVKTTFPET